MLRPCATWRSNEVSSAAVRAEITTLRTASLLVLATSAWRSRVLPLPRGPVTSSRSWL